MAAGRAVASARSLDVEGGRVALRMTVTGSSDSVPVIRALVRRATDLWGYEAQLVDDAALVVSELTANAVLHGQAGGCDCLDVRLKPGHQRLRIEVADASSSLPRQKAPDSTSETGRGLLMVEAVCGRWGVVRDTPQGKTVWAEIVVGTS